MLILWVNWLFKLYQSTKIFLNQIIYKFRETFERIVKSTYAITYVKSTLYALFNFNALAVNIYNLNDLTINICNFDDLNVIREEKLNNNYYKFSKNIFLTNLSVKKTLFKISFVIKKTLRWKKMSLF